MTKVPKAKFRIGQKVEVSLEDDMGHTSVSFGKVKLREYMWHPENWGDDDNAEPHWGYIIENCKDSPEDVEGLFRESDLQKFDKDNW